MTSLLEEEEISIDNLYKEFNHVKNELKKVKAMKTKTLNDTFRSDMLKLNWDSKKKIEILGKLLDEERILLFKYVVLNERVQKDTREKTIVLRYDL